MFKVDKLLIETNNHLIEFLSQDLTWIDVDNFVGWFDFYVDPRIDKYLNIKKYTTISLIIDTSMFVHFSEYTHLIFN